VSVTIGVAVSSDAVRAVAVKDGVVKWALQTERAAGHELGSDIKTLLSRAPLSRWRRPRVVAVVGPSSAQTKLLTGLPQVQDRDALAGIVRESAGRFFLRNGIPLTTSGVRVDGDGAWVAAFERPVIEAIEDACARRKLRLGFVAPTLVVLSLATAQRTIQWRDGDAVLDVLYAADGRLCAVKRGTDTAISASESPAVPALAALGSGAWQFADAYGAAVASSGEPIAWRGWGERGGKGVLSRAGKVAAVAALLAAAAALLVPSIADAISVRRSSVQLATLAARTKRAVVARSELAHMSRALSEITAFASTRHSSVLLLGAVTHALPDAAALASIHTDSTSGTMVIVAPRIAAAMSALDSVRSISALEIVGPVTKEIANGKEVERASVRFRLSRSPTTAK
jgi:hypothetical protein